MELNVKWWQTQEMLPDLEAICCHLNEARQPMNAVLKCTALFKALNSLWTAHKRSRGSPLDSDSQALTTLFLEGISEDKINTLCTADITKRLASLDDPILDHKILRSSKEYRPNQRVPEKLQKEAASEYNKFMRTYNRWDRDPTPENTTSLMKKLGQILYIVRSNIAHGEKTPHGPDLAKADRDRTVSELCIPVIERFFDLFFDSPSNLLVVYGTLAPGESNDFLLSQFKGDWFRGRLRGSLKTQDNLLVFQWGSKPNTIEVQLFRSLELSDCWKIIDDFEGSAYRRILVPVEITDRGRIVVANIYADSFE